MDWWAPVDIYCERTAPDFWAEPVNAVTNGAFLAAGLVFLVLARRRGADPWVIALCIWVAVIGIGSFLFHTVATRWAALADVLPIWSFVPAYVLFALVRLLGLPWGRALLVFAGGIAGVAAVMALLPDGAGPATNGSIQYLPAVIALVAFAIAFRWTSHPAAATVGLATAVFVVSLVARSVDEAVCPALPLGTHFLWHLLNAAMLALLLRTAVLWGGRAPAATR